VSSIERINNPIVQRIGNDSIYGPGIDGDVVISNSTVTLSRDMYYNTLTVTSSGTLNTNGFRVFVKDTLNIGGFIGVNQGVTVPTGTVAGTTATATSVTNAIGGSAYGSTYQASQLSTAMLNSLDVAISGTYVETTGALIALKGGAGGGSGAAGIVTPATSGFGATAGGAGGAGHLNRNTGVAGGPGHAGTPGTNGVAGSTPPAAVGGLGASGGPVVVIVAKTIIGTGTIASRGSNATAGGSSATGSGATNGSAGSAGSTAPAAALAHHVDGNAHYITGDGTHGGHTSVASPNLPRSYLAGTEVLSEQHIHRFVHRNNVYHSTAFGHGEHNLNCQGGYNYAHTYSYYDGRPSYAPASSFYHVNGINHSNLVYSYGHYNHHNFNTTPVYFPHCAHTYLDNKGNVQHNHGRWPHQHHDNWQYYTLGRAASSDIKSVGHSHYPGGSGGSAGLAGTNGTNGSTTAGSNGQSGGGGGIICVTDSIANTLTLNASGGSIGGQEASSGMIVTIINS
jgi:hypothetical protein